jgi:hypothetical protein
MGAWADIWFLTHAARSSRTLARTRTANPHFWVTKVTRTGQLPASAYFFRHVLDHTGIRPKGLRSARLVDLVNNLDPKLVPPLA